MGSIQNHYVFIAGASDTESYKSIAKEVIDELNQHWYQVIPFRVIGKTFEDVQPGRGKYPQQVINRQFIENVETFTAVVKGKNGTPTPNHRSGTSEEISLAIERSKDGRPDILIYRVCSPYGEPDLEIDEGVEDLLQELGRQGILYHSVDSELTFERRYRVHLVTSIQSRTEEELPGREELWPEAELGDEVLSDGPPSTEEKPGGADGFLAIALWATKVMPLGASHLQPIIEAFGRLSQELERVDGYYSRGSSTRSASAERYVMNRLASSFLECSRKLEAEGLLFHLYVGLGLMSLDVASKGDFRNFLRTHPRVLEMVDHFMGAIRGQLEGIGETYSWMPGFLDQNPFGRKKSPVTKASRRFSDRLRRFLQTNSIIINFLHRSDSE